MAVYTLECSAACVVWAAKGFVNRSAMRTRNFTVDTEIHYFAAFFSAQRFRCASAIALRPAALIFRLALGALGALEGFVVFVPLSTARARCRLAISASMDARIVFIVMAEIIA
jgi:hypothetical protein